MAKEAVWNATNLYETVALMESYRCRILRIHRELQLQNTVVSCMLCNLVQKVCGNPGSAQPLRRITGEMNLSSMTC